MVRKDNFVKFCEDCRGKCCFEARPPLTKSRAENIARYLHERGQNPLRKRVYRYTHPDELDDGYCFLFDHASGLCRVHPVKPETCVAGPVTFDINRLRGTVEWYLKREKICRLAGHLAHEKVALSKHLEVAKQEILRLVEELEEDELAALLEIEEDDTFKIGEDPLPDGVLNRLSVRRLSK